MFLQLKLSEIEFCLKLSDIFLQIVPTIRHRLQFVSQILVYFENYLTKIPYTNS